jgi:hypothetical protein
MSDPGPCTWLTATSNHPFSGRSSSLFLPQTAFLNNLRALPNSTNLLEPASVAGERFHEVVVGGWVEEGSGQAVLSGR